MFIIGDGVEGRQTKWIEKMENGVEGRQAKGTETKYAGVEK